MPMEDIISHHLKIKTQDDSMQETNSQVLNASSNLPVSSEVVFKSESDVKNKNTGFSFLKSEDTEDLVKAKDKSSEDNKSTESQIQLEKASSLPEKDLTNTKHHDEEESRLTSLTGDGIVETAINAIHRNNFSDNTNTLQASQDFFESTKQLPNEENFVNDQLIENQKLGSTFNLQQLPPPPALPSGNHSVTTSSTLNSVEMLPVRQNSQPLNDHYYAHCSSANLESHSSSSSSSFPSASSSTHAQITVLQQSSQQNQCPNYETSTSTSASPSQAFITHYPHALNENIVQSHVIHHRPAAEIEHFHQQVPMPHHVENDPNIIHPQSIEMAHADALALQLQQPIFDQARNMYVYPNSLVECHVPNGLESHHLETEMPHSSHQPSSKIEINQSNEHYISAPLQRSISGGQARSRKREQSKLEEMESDIFDSSQPVPDKTIEDVLKGTPGNEHKKRKIDEILK